MPKKIVVDPFLSAGAVSRLAQWGRIVRTQRVRTKVTAGNFCERIGISLSTLRRIEAGDPAVSVGSYLSALSALGVLDMAIPHPGEQLGSESPRSRAPKTTKDDDYF
ncbi:MULTISPECIES: helix-turn-helix transcriptional regulator [unclassified Achromobacter]|uniref:helix-turn-helix domain-containing protein n=1 Tax=unclassified Achromobacter TaxID=2626865 RepID=UPI000B517BCE|nr:MULTISPECIES: helix-turn-helix transcriptional regulator [unclassified Achromobacter]OWT80282.1 transcriptional regulator [Achromobacter sp. HZ34]OWT82165.1 transcriptional regulator [Achromobacter sp. HZ28]